MRFTVVTILPELIEPCLAAGVVGRAREAGTITVDTVNPRDFTHDRHRTVDDNPYGGGPGMVMKAEPLLAAIARASEPAAAQSPVSPLEDSDDITSTLRFARPQPTLAPDDIATTRPFARPPRDVAASIASVDSSIDKLEHALDGNLDALVAQDAIEGAGEASSPSPSPDPGTSMDPSSRAGRAHRILLSPSGKPLTQARVRELAALPHLVLVCGRYEGLDQRVIDAAIDEEISIGDFVLSGGELGALVIIDAVSRYVPGVLGAADSVDEESFSAGLLEYPQYTRPPELAAAHVPPDRTIERTIPPILQSGNHAAIAAWRRKQSIERTATRRPDLFRSFVPSKADAKLVPPLRKRTHVALVHHPVVDRVGTVITTALTNFDIHDLARSTMTFGLAGYHIVTPITSQREKAEHIAKLWSEDEQGEHRAAALRLIRTAAAVEDVIAAIAADHGEPPLVVATSAKASSFPDALRRSTTELLAETSSRSAPVLLLLGTGWGLADSLIPSVSRVLAPIEGGSDWNHLSVRSAGAIILDRLFGRPA